MMRISLRALRGIVLCLALALALAAVVGGAFAATDGHRSALVVIDIQNAYLPYMEQADVEPALATINAAIDLFRSRGLPVLRVYHTDLELGPPTDSEAFRFPSTVRIAESDPMVVKHYPDAFKKTDLAEILGGLPCDTVFLCGLSATGCVLATYHGALDRDLPTCMVKDGLISPRAHWTDAVEEFTRAMSLDAIAQALDDAQD